MLAGRRRYRARALRVSPSADFGDSTRRPPTRAPNDPFDGNDASEVDAAPDARFWPKAIILALLLIHATIFLIGFLLGHLSL
jgi:hypothetical protein